MHSNSIALMVWILRTKNNLFTTDLIDRIENRVLLLFISDFIYLLVGRLLMTIQIE